MGKNKNGKELGQGISQRSDGRYCGRFTDRFQKRHTFYGKTVNEVREKLRNAQYEDEHGLNGTGQGVILDEWFDIFIRDYKQNIRLSTLRGYYSCYARIKDILGKMPVVDIKQLHIQRIITDMQEQGFKSGTIKTHKAFLHNLFESAVLSDLIPKNPVNGIVVRDTEETDVKVLTIGEQELFLNHIKDSWYAELFNILLLTGMRIGEAMALTWEDVDLSNRKLSINKSLAQVATGANGHGKYEYILSEPKTKSSIRDLRLLDETISFFERQYEKCAGIRHMTRFGNLVFVGRNGEFVSESNIRNILRSACNTIRKRGNEIISISPHVFRHTFATRCYESGMDWYSISRILGHADVETTMAIYVHCLPDKIDEEIKKFKVVGVGSKTINVGDCPTELVVCKDINHEFCVVVEKCENLTVPYVKIYNRSDYTKATQVAYLRIDRAEYKKTVIDENKTEWTLSEIEQNRLVELLKDRSQKKQWGTNWETLILEFNRLNGLQPENTLHNFQRNPLFGDYLCYDTPIPDYTLLPIGKGKIWKEKLKEVV